jgi:hypothetical protein
MWIGVSYMLTMRLIISPYVILYVGHSEIADLYRNTGRKSKSAADTASLFPNAYIYAQRP